MVQLFRGFASIFIIHMVQFIVFTQIIGFFPCPYQALGFKIALVSYNQLGSFLVFNFVEQFVKVRAGFCWRWTEFTPKTMQAGASLGRNVWLTSNFLSALLISKFPIFSCALVGSIFRVSSQHLQLDMSYRNPNFWLFFGKKKGGSSNTEPAFSWSKSSPTPTTVSAHALRLAKASDPCGSWPCLPGAPVTTPTWGLTTDVHVGLHQKQGSFPMTNASLNATQVSVPLLNVPG